MSDDELGVSAFLNKKGTVGIFVRLGSDEGMLTTRLTKAVHISSSTVSDRLIEGRKKDFFKIVRKPEDHGNATRNQLTDRGERLRKEIESVGLVDAYEQYFQSIQQLDTGEEELLDWVQESEITDPMWSPGLTRKEKMEKYG